MNAIDVLVIDKTGTVTEGKPSVEKVISVKPDYTENDILQKIVALNNNSEHPLAQAKSRYGKEKNVAVQSVSNSEAVTGKGVNGKLTAYHTTLWKGKLMAQGRAAVKLKRRV